MSRSRFEAVRSTNNTNRHGAWKRKKDPSNMPTLKILPSGKTAQIAAGTTLLAGLTTAGETIKTKCTDTACSGMCHVFVPVGKKSLSKMQRAENEQLDTIPGVSGKSRLACQARMGEEDVTLELLGFDS